MKKLSFILALIFILALAASCSNTGPDDAADNGTNGNDAEVVNDGGAEAVNGNAPEADDDIAETVIDTTNWLSPMVSVEKNTQEISLWGGEYGLHRNETMEYVLIQGDVVSDTEITADTLIAGGAVPATLRLEYGGDDEYMVRFVAFAYEFFDHGRPARLSAHAAEPNPQEILVLWQNPENGHWFNMIQNGVGREDATRGQNHGGIVSLRNGNPVYTFLLNSETAAELSEMEVFIVATAAPTRDEEYERSGYSLQFSLELPDLDNHFHSWEILASCGTMIIVAADDD